MGHHLSEQCLGAVVLDPVLIRLFGGQEITRKSEGIDAESTRLFAPPPDQSHPRLRQQKVVRRLWGVTRRRITQVQFTGQVAIQRVQFLGFLNRIDGSWASGDHAALGEWVVHPFSSG